MYLFLHVQKSVKNDTRGTCFWIISFKDIQQISLLLKYIKLYVCKIQ